MLLRTMLLVFVRYGYNTGLRVLWFRFWVLGLLYSVGLKWFWVGDLLVFCWICVKFASSGFIVFVRFTVMFEFWLFVDTLLLFIGCSLICVFWMLFFNLNNLVWVVGLLVYCWFSLYVVEYLLYCKHDWYFEFVLWILLVICFYLGFAFAFDYWLCRCS